MKLVFDVGANEGTLIPIWLAWGADVVVAVEPNSGCIEILKQKFGDHARVIIVHAAVGEQEGMVDLNICDGDWGLSSVDMSTWRKSRYGRTRTFSKTETVTQTTLDRLREQFGQPDYVKIDVEGYERSVLHGMSIPPPLLSFEFHGELNQEAIECSCWLYHLGMRRFYPTTEEVSRIPEEKNWVSIGEVNVWLDKVGPESWGNVFASL